jgi:hypothetical protein
LLTVRQRARPGREVGESFVELADGRIKQRLNSREKIMAHARLLPFAPQKGFINVRCRGGADDEAHQSLRLADAINTSAPARHEPRC